jgi:hypothetical protein
MDERSIELSSVGAALKVGAAGPVVVLLDAEASEVPLLFPSVMYT